MAIFTLLFGIAVYALVDSWFNAISAAIAKRTITAIAYAIPGILLLGSIILTLAGK